MTVAMWLIAGLAGALTLHTVINARLLPRASDRPGVVAGPVSVLLPVRDERDRVEACLRSVLRQRGVPRLEVVVVDDGSTDATADVVRRVAGDDPRVRLVAGAATPPGWLGKPYACHQLAGLATGATLVFVDADVVLGPDAVAAAVELLTGVDLVSPFPRLVAGSWAERLVQPLLPWSWLTFLPVRVMERSSRPSLAAAGGQFLVVDRRGYEQAGGHRAVRAEVLDDVALARAVKRAGGRIRIADASALASCRMYTSWEQLRAGYTKSAWSAFGSPTAGIVVAATLVLLYVGPVAGVVAGVLSGVWPWVWAGLTGYAAGVAGRLVSATATSGRTWPDILAQPASVAVFGWLVLASVRARRQGSLTWKGRGVAP